MSGGSWDYVYFKFEETADRLLESKSPERRALGRLIRPMTKALHDIEWADSGDRGQGSELPAILAALGNDAPNKTLSVLVDEALKLKETLEKYIEEAKQ